jgi:hypothetical protein
MTYIQVFQVTSSGFGWDSSVDTATRYGLNGPGIEFRRSRVFPYPSRPALGPILPPIQWVSGHYRGKAAGAWRWRPTPIERRGSRKSKAIPLLHLWVFVVCSRVTFIFTLLFSAVLTKHHQNVFLIKNRPVILRALTDFSQFKPTNAHSND